MKRVIKINSFLLVFLLAILAACNKDDNSKAINITLWNKPLNVIQSYIKGKWRLQYTYGGFLPTKYIDKYNTYTIFTPDHMTVGNDSDGIIFDANIKWIKTLAYSDDSIYVMSYYQSGYSFPIVDIILEIRNDTLVTRDFTSEPFFYYYTRW